MATSWVAIHLLGSTNTKDIAHEVINRVRLQMIKSRPKAKELITSDIWKQKMRLVHTNLSENIEK